MGTLETTRPGVVEAWRAVVRPWIDSRRAQSAGAGIHWLEIGSFEGESAEYTLREYLTEPADRLVCVDPFGIPCSESRFDSRMQGFGPRIEKHKMRSFDFLTRAIVADPGRRFDVVYVDGCHDAAAVLADCVVSWPLLRVGGLLICDDYAWRHPARQYFAGFLDPAAGINGFLGGYELQLTTLHKAQQVIVQKRRLNCADSIYSNGRGL